MKILDGKTLAQSIENDLIRDVAALKSKVTPKLATILVGDDPSSKVYVAMKQKACERVGIQSVRIELPKNTTTEGLLAAIKALNDDASVHGILLQHPVPHAIDERRCFDAIAIHKDVDGVTSLGFGHMTMGLPAFVSATPLGIATLLKRYNVPVAGKHAVVVGRSAILGKPVAQLLLNLNATVTICHSHTQNLRTIVQTADILVAACGKPRFIKASWLKEGAVIVDAGYHPERVGDVDFDTALERYSAYTPVPGGVGPMTISSLLCQTVAAAREAVRL